MRFWRIIRVGLLITLARPAIDAPAADVARPRSNPARANDAADARALAARIDARLESAWTEAKVRPGPPAEDGEFLRRASLDLVGKIPSAAEARDFIDDPSPSKRDALIDRLVESPAYQSRATVLWRQLLLPAGDGEVVGSDLGFDAWLRKKVADETGYDQIVREILSVKLNGQGGAMVSAGEPTPAGFFSAKGGKPEVIAADSARAFLGLRLDCAQCHNHPFASWKREQFWEFAAFFAGVPGQSVDDNGNVINNGRPRDPEKLRQLSIPGTQTVVNATHLDRSKPEWNARLDTREVLANWITSADNPYFARAVVNRVWARYLGTGLIEPIDDLDAEHDPAFDGLLNDLAGEFRRHAYDLKFLVRVITSTRAYRMTSALEPGESTPPPMFARMPVRGLSPAQLVECLGIATGNASAGDRAGFVELFSTRDERPTEAQTSILQSLTLMNGPWIERATNPRTGNLLGAVAEAPFLDTAARVDAIYLAALARRPRPEEKAMLVEYIDKRPEGLDRSAALGDAFWALLNGPEFRLNR